MVEKTEQEKLEAYNRMVEGGRRGGKQEKHYTDEGLQKRIEGSRKGGLNSWKTRKEQEVK